MSLAIKESELLEKVIFLKKTNLFSSMRTIELRTLASIAERFTFTKEDVVVKEDDVGDSMYIIESGSVRIEKKQKGGKSILLATLKPGEYFGEMALFDAELRSASAIADEECTLLNIRSDDLHDVLLDHPTIAIDLIKTFVKRLRNTTSGVSKER